LVDSLIAFHLAKVSLAKIEILIEVCQIWNLGFWVESRLAVGVTCLLGEAIA
jgi:hypothetical protein